MEPLIPRLIAQAAPRASRRPTVIPATLLRNCRVPSRVPSHLPPTLLSHRRSFTSGPHTWSPRPKEALGQNGKPPGDAASYAQPAAAVSQTVHPEEKSHFARIEAESKHKQRESPWMREGSDVPPVARQRSASAMTKGKLLTTPSRMLKFILPLSTRDTNKDRKDVEPLALLVHPQQPLSYLERLIQSELPLMENERPPSVVFKAEDSQQEAVPVKKAGQEEFDEDLEEQDSEEPLENGDETRIDGKIAKTGKVSSSSSAEASLPAHGHSSSPPEPPSTSTENNRPTYVRWSPSTEIGDFIRDAARGSEFAVEIQNAPPIYVGVPSFNDRTYYLRMRLRKTAKRITHLADVKKECDNLAHKGAKRVAQGGFAGLIGWWGAVYYLTFMTDLGWDVMEPVTYLVGLSGLCAGYLWFLYNNREVSYRSAMNLTVSRRQSQLYAAKGFDVAKWEGLVEEGNRLRREIKLVAEEYDVDWDESSEANEKVSEALRKERKRKSNDEGEDDDDEDGKKGKQKDD